MTRNCCNFVIPLLGVLLVAAYTTSLQNRIVVEDFNYNNYQGYQNYQPVEKYDKPINDYQDYQNFRPAPKFNRPINDYQDYQNFQPAPKYNKPINEYQDHQNFQPAPKYNRPINEYQDHQNFQPAPKYNKPINEYQDYQNFRPVAKFDRPIVVKALEKPKNQQDFSKIPGIPGVDFPLYHTVPPTSFSCAHVPFVPGMYANVETGCQAYHICHDGREGHQGASFLCTNGTLFNQKDFGCDWWYNVNCAEAPSLYRINADPLKNPFVPKEKKDAYRKQMRIVVV